MEYMLFWKENLAVYHKQLRALFYAAIYMFWLKACVNVMKIILCMC